MDEIHSPLCRRKKKGYNFFFPSLSREGLPYNIPPCPLRRLSPRVRRRLPLKHHDAIVAPLSRANDSIPLPPSWYYPSSTGKHDLRRKRRGQRGGRCPRQRQGSPRKHAWAPRGRPRGRGELRSCRRRPGGPRRWKQRRRWRPLRLGVFVKVFYRVPEWRRSWGTIAVLSRAALSSASSYGSRIEVERWGLRSLEDSVC